MVTGIGVDIVKIARIDKMIQRYGDRFLQRCFSPGEREAAQARRLGQAQVLAARWAAKEAFLKCLGQNVLGIPYRDIEVVRTGEGPVQLVLHGKARAALARTGATTAFLAISHETDYAVATVVAQE